VKEAKKRREERQDVKRKEVLQVPHILLFPLHIMHVRTHGATLLLAVFFRSFSSNKDPNLFLKLNLSRRKKRGTYFRTPIFCDKLIEL
jgi:hypothetical protein